MIIENATKFVCAHWEKLSSYSTSKFESCKSSADLRSNLIKKLKTVRHYLCQINNDEGTDSRGTKLLSMFIMKERPKRQENKLKKIFPMKNGKNNFDLLDCVSKMWRMWLRNFVSSKEASKLVEDEFYYSSKYIYDLILDTDADVNVKDTVHKFVNKVFNYTFVCEKANRNIYPMIFVYKLYASILKIARSKITQNKNSGYTQIVMRDVVSLFDQDGNIEVAFKLL